MPKYKYEIRYVCPPNSIVDVQIDADSFESDEDSFTFLIEDDDAPHVERTVLEIRTCHVVYVREVGIVEAAESGS